MLRRGVKRGFFICEFEFILPSFVIYVNESYPASLNGISNVMCAAIICFVVITAFLPNNHHMHVAIVNEHGCWDPLVDTFWA